MAKFLTALIMEEVREGTWQLDSALVYQSEVAAKVIVVPRGFITDLASVPRLPVAYWLVGGMAHKAAVVHDWLYTSHEVTRSVADGVLREASRLEGLPLFKSFLLWLGVRVGGFGPWASAEQRQRQEKYVRDLIKEQRDADERTYWGA